MTVLNFPASPTLNDTYTENNVVYTWDGTKWTANNSISFDARYVLKAGDVVTGSLTTPGRTITAVAFDLATGPYWTCGAIAIPNPTNGVAGMSGLIRLTAAPSGWGSNFSTAPTPTVFPSIVPFYVESATKIRLGSAVGVA
jgi:hypothetical protein